MHGKIKIWQGALTPGVEKMTRQRVRAKLREECFDEINARSRHWHGTNQCYIYDLTQAERRQWALAEAHSRYREQKGLPSGV